MLILKRELNIGEFFYLCDLNTAQGQEEFERILDYVRQDLYKEIPQALDEKFNAMGNKNYKYENYVIEYKKVAWDARRLYDEIHKYPKSVGKYLFNGKLYRPDYFEEMVLSVKPFDLYLYIKTIDEYKKEELMKVYKERG